MLWAYFVLFLGWLFSGLESQLILTQPSSMSTSPGLTFNIPCRMNIGYSINSERVRWYQQKPGGAPRFLYHYYTSTDQGRGTGVPERFSVSPDISQNLWNLVINGVQVEDDAVYYCNTWDYKLTGWVFGGGTQLTVTGQPTVSPSVQVFAPSQEEIRSPNPYTVVCLITDFYPPAFLVQWKGDEGVIISGVETTKASKQGDKYLASSYLKLTAAEYNTYQSFTCEVTHENKKISKTVSKSGSC